MAGEGYKVILAERADKMLAAHTEFLARVSLSAARRLLSDFRKATAAISENPLQYPYADGADADDIPHEMYRKCLFYGRYKALYLIEADMVYIDAIIDCRRENSDLY
jgi:plasmid stabilization system protein ParE